MKNPLVLTATLAALSLVSGCSSEPQSGTKVDADAVNKVAADEVAVNQTVVAETKTDGFTSSITNIAFDPVAALPKAPASAETQRDCDFLLPQTGSDAARQVSAAGWGVTGEARIGRYQAVSFAGSFERGTSGSCAVGKGNIAFFDSGKIVAIASVPVSKRASIGRVSSFEDSGLRIWNGDIVPAPIADIRVVEDKGLIVQPLAAQERVCGGKASVPNIYGMPISKARKLVAQQGFEPVGNGDAADREDAREADLAGKGIKEVAACSGTGFAFCSYDYKHPDAALAITTVGDSEDPTVSDYGVRCSG